MRGLPLLLVSILLAGFLSWTPGASAQAAGAPIELLQDAAGDLKATVGDTEVAVPESRFKALDLVGLEMAETAETFTLTVRVAGLDQTPEAPGLDDSITTVNLRHNDQEYEAVFLRALGDQSYYWGYLLKYDPEGVEENFQRVLEVVADPAAGTLSTTLLRDEILDRNGAAPFPGRAFDGFRAATVLRSSQGFANVNGIDPGRSYNVHDRMPDTGIGETPFPIRLGLEQSGHAALWSPDPIRASNGEQSTYVFNLTALNSGSQSEFFAVTTKDVPREWQVVIPDAYLRLGAGEARSIPVLVSTPFTHIHGSLVKFRVELASESEPGSVGRVDLGVRYFAVPQPGGHHNVLYMHSTSFGSGSPLFEVFDLGFAGNSGFVYWNTLETDPMDSNTPVTGNFQGYYCETGCPPEVPRVEWEWGVFLQPSLEMGLDFDLAGTGVLNVPIQAQAPLTQATLGGRIMHLHYSESQATWIATAIANFSAPPRDFMPNEAFVYTFPFQPDPAADFLPHAKRAYFAVVLNLTSVKPSLFTGAEAPLLLPSGDLTLPLFEYRDPLMASFSTMGAIRLEAVGEHERYVNPGKTAVFTTRLTNDLDDEHTFQVTLAGTRTEWARVLGSSEVTVAPRSAVEVHVAVAVPADATDRDAVDLIVTAQVRDQPTLHGLTRIVALIDLAGEHPDESGMVPSLDVAQAKQGPMPVLPLVAVLLLALAGTRPRRNA